MLISKKNIKRTNENVQNWGKLVSGDKSLIWLKRNQHSLERFLKEKRFSISSLKQNSHPNFVVILVGSMVVCTKCKNASHLPYPFPLCKQAICVCYSLLRNNLSWRQMNFFLTNELRIWIWPVSVTSEIWPYLVRWLTILSIFERKSDLNFCLKKHITKFIVFDFGVFDTSDNLKAEMEDKDLRIFSH